MIKLRQMLTCIEALDQAGDAWPGVAKLLPGYVKHGMGQDRTGLRPWVEFESEQQPPPRLVRNEDTGHWFLLGTRTKDMP